MKHYEKMHSCLHCHSYIDENVYTYSTTNYGYELCYTCQSSINLNNSTAEARELYLSLKRRGVPAELEKFDGHKTIDIAVVDARVNIEVDSHQHISNTKQALSELKRTYFSFQQGFLTLRIPNALIREKLEETADYITTFLLENKHKIRSSFY
jgi:very-short-patch-repair endonuclease